MKPLESWPSAPTRCGRTWRRSCVSTRCRRSPSTRTDRSARSTSWASRSRPSSATPTCSRPSTWPASPGTPGTEQDPVVIAGGHSAFNPEPVADFVDAAVLGDGEQVVLEISEVVRQWKVDGLDRVPGGRRELLLRLARTGGVYVPSLYDVDYLPDGRIQRVAPRPDAPGVPWRVSKHTVMDLDAWPYPKQPLVPLAESVHERSEESRGGERCL